MSNIPHTLSSAIVPRSLYALEQSILGWAHERNLIKGSTCRKQLAKTCEEFGELAAGLNKGKHALIKDGVGDVLVTLIIANGCAGGEYLFPTTIDPDWIQPPPHIRNKGCAELVIHTLQELSYVASVNDAGNWRTSLCYDLVRALSAASEFAGCGLAECLLTSWLEIKDRKGRMIDGVFVKEADLPTSPEQEAPVPPDHNC